MIGGGRKGGWGLRLLVDLGVLEAEEEAPDEAAEEAERRQAISLFLGLSPLCMSCRNMYMSWHPSLCRMSISLEVYVCDYFSVGLPQLILDPLAI